MQDLDFTLQLGLAPAISREIMMTSLCLAKSLTCDENLHVTVRTCLHGGGGPQVGEVTRLAVVEKWSAFTCKVTTPGSRGDVTRRCCKCNMNSTPARRVTPP